MTQSKGELEAWYAKKDPWGYQTTADDYLRKGIIIGVLNTFAPFQRALDIGCGEGWITQDLPAAEIHGIELSDGAALRFPENVKRVSQPDGKYDLVVATGVLYAQYDYQQILDWMVEAASGIVLTCNIKEWEIMPFSDAFLQYTVEFPYRDYVQKLRVYKW